jgi:hypothetical protein
MEKNNNWEVIDFYSREQALADGVQVRCPDDIRKEAGIKFPVFFTRTLWDQYIEPPGEVEGEGQNLDGRLWDALYMWTFNVKAQRPAGNRMYYKVIFIMPKKVKTPNDSRTGKPVTVTLESVIGPTDFDDPSPAITIMLPGED